jgi:hypothetical protein
MDRRADLGIALAFVVLGTVVIALTTRIGTTLVVDPIGPRGFGYVLGAALVLGGSAAGFSRVRRWDEAGGGNVVPSEGASDEEGTPSSAGRPLLVLLSAGLYIALLEVLGFLLATPLFLGALLRLMRTRGRRARVVIPIVFTVVVFVVFTLGLNVGLPAGPFRSIFVEFGILSY